MPLKQYVPNPNSGLSPAILNVHCGGIAAAISSEFFIWLVEHLECAARGRGYIQVVQYSQLGLPLFL